MTINPLVAARLEGAKDPWSGIWIAEDIELISQGIKESSWVNATLGVVGASLDGLALISDPLGALLQYGVAWIIEHVKPLTEVLDWLAGDPAQIAAHAQTWRNVAKSLQDQATRPSKEPCSAAPASTSYAAESSYPTNAITDRDVATEIDPEPARGPC
jgi:hypothetical protein